MKSSKEIFTQPMERSEDITVESFDKSILIKYTIDIAEQMLACGAEVSRIEESVSRICNAYGAYKTDVFCITSLIIVTVIWGNGDIMTQSRRISQGSKNFKKFEMLNALSRDMCEYKLKMEEIDSRLSKIVNLKHASKILNFLGCVLAAGSFALYFGGELIDALAAMICGATVFAIEEYIYDRRMNKVIYFTLCSFATGVVAVALVTIGVGCHLDKIMIGCIMLLIPGLNFTAAVEDILAGDTATGALRIFESALTACAIALGFALAVYFINGGNIV